MRVLVTGGAGFVGGHVVDKLLEAGHCVRSIQRSPAPELLARGVEVALGDLAAPDVAPGVVRGMDAVIHVAAKAGIWGTFGEFARINVEGTRNLLAACRAEGVRRFVYTSTPSVVYGELPLEGADETAPYPARYLSPYPETKALAERLVLAAHEPGTLHTIALRPHLVFGPRDRHLIPRLVEAARRGRVARVGDEENLVSVSYVENVADAHRCALDAIEAPDSVAGGKAYFINEPEPVPLWPFIDRLLAGLGAPPIRRRVSLGAARTVGAILEWTYATFRLPGEPRMTRFLAAQLGTAHWFRVDAARRDLGFESRIDLEGGLRRLFEANRA